MKNIFSPFTQRDKLGRYYTECNISDFLVSQMSTKNAINIIDLAAGAGSLTIAASSRWKNAEIFSLDIEERMYGKITSNQTHIIADGLTHSFPDNLSKYEGNFDVAVCNPPFIRPEWRDDFKKIILEIGAEKYFSITQKPTSELIFLSQIIRMLKDGGEAGVILPDGIFTSKKYSGVRSFLLNEHSVRKVIELPRKVFKRTEAKTHILIFNKKSSSNNNEEIELSSIDVEGKTSLSIFIKKEEAISRMDYSFYEKTNKEKKYLDELPNLYIKRGRFSSKELSHEVIHTTQIKEFQENIVLSCDSTLLLKNKKSTLAQPGDILMARVGRNFHKKIVYVNKGYAHISDCLFIIRLPEPENHKLFQFLRSSAGQEELKRTSCGVAAKHITIAALKKINILGEQYE
ncbi:N-6 DNA methylase [Pectobacterium versatile]|nr:N-6 DNA methylase [Pectobacterium versatile]MBA0172638.1 N-6 DNA methylase [Pectobacterium versatile]QQK74028.1 N-6 DNA methylase [Pectobacterium versatile]